MCNGALKQTVNHQFYYANKNKTPKISIDAWQFSFFVQNVSQNLQAIKSECGVSYELAVAQPEATSGRSNKTKGMPSALEGISQRVTEKLYETLTILDISIRSEI